LGKHRVTAGNEYRYNSRQDQENYDADPYFSYLNDKRGSRIWALYAVDEFRIRENLIVNAGLRYDHYDTFGGTANPRLALIYKPDEHGSVKLLYGQAFRAPNSFELFYQASDITKSNPFLQPETIRTTELVFERYLKRFRFVVSAFYNDIHGLITEVMDPTDGKIHFSNLENVKGKGVETAIEMRLPNGIEGGVSYTMQNSLSERTRDSLSNSPSHLAKMRFSVPLARRKVFASFQGFYTSERRTLGDANLAGHFVSNATLFGKSLFKGCDLSAGVYNLFNVRYANPGAEEHVQDSITQDGRSYRLKLTYSFHRGK
jgi:iron complex outermembrane receptor protein